MTAYALLVPLLLAAAVTDIYGHRIPNWLTGSAAFMAIVSHAACEGLHGLMLSSAGLAVGLALLAPFYAAGGTGAGDVKLMGAIGSLLGPKGVLLAFLFTAMVGGLYAVLFLLVRGFLGVTISRYGSMVRLFCYSGNLVYVRPSDKEGKLILRYAVPIAIGTFLSLWKGSYVFWM